MSARNKAIGPFHVESKQAIGDATVTTLVADMIDTKLNHRYQDGTYKVEIVNKPAIAGQPRTKSFYGESAWNNAQRYAYDAVIFFQRYVGVR